jgi:hypothetical protein
LQQPVAQNGRTALAFAGKFDDALGDDQSGRMLAVRDVSDVHTSSNAIDMALMSFGSKTPLPFKNGMMAPMAGQSNLSPNLNGTMEPACFLDESYVSPNPYTQTVLVKGLPNA